MADKLDIVHPDRKHSPHFGTKARCPCRTCEHLTAERNPDEELSWWSLNEGPGPLLSKHHGLKEVMRHPARWIDHPYRLRLPDGRWRYVAEPYDIDEKCLKDLAFLAGCGFTVIVSAWQARHYPGRTTAISIEENF